MSGVGDVVRIDVSTRVGTGTRKRSGLVAGTLMGLVSGVLGMVDTGGGLLSELVS